MCKQILLVWLLTINTIALIVWTTPIVWMMANTRCNDIAIYVPPGQMMEWIVVDSAQINVVKLSLSLFVAYE
jgi:hypothetical protein